MSNWIKVSETLPRVNQEVLGFIFRDTMEVVVHIGEGRFFDSYSNQVDVVFWCQLPESPYERG